MATIAVGLVGYYQFIRGYPLGPELKERLDALHWPEHDVEIREMNWGPVAIVQDFEASNVAYDRVVLIAAVERGGKKRGTVTCRRWVGGKLDVLTVQDRIFEAVTGVISVDNLLVIGEHFGIWPQDLIVIEVELAESSIGDLVLQEANADLKAGRGTSVGQHPISPNDKLMVEEVASLANLAVSKGLDGLPNVVPLSAKDLNPLAKICHNQLIDDIRLEAPIN